MTVPVRAAGPAAVSAAATRTLMLALLLAVTGCAADGAPGAKASDTITTKIPAPEVTLPPGELRALVPEAKDLPIGLVPLIAGSGERNLKAIAGFSADPAAAEKALTAHGLTDAYVAQYADPKSARVLSVVVTRFATTKGASDDLAGDLASSGGSVLPTPAVGEASQLRRQPLPQATPAGELITLRFRSGATTWLVAYTARPTADPDVPMEIARLLVARANQQA